MNRGPLVGVTMSMTIDATPERAYVNSAYLHAVQQAGGVPVLLPPQLSAASLERLGRGLDALLLTGGGDMDPSHFGESPHPSLYEVADPGTEVAHSQKEARDQPTHKVTVTPGSRLARVMGADEVEVNSFHHQVIKSLGRGLTAVAWAPDHLIEGVELEDDTRWVLGVQWHPEHLTKDSEPARRLFAALVTAART